MASADIVLTGLAANDPVPGVYVEENFAQGPAAGDSSPREVLLMGNKTSSGSAVADTQVYGPDTQVPLQTEQDCINLFGAGSELHRMFRRFTTINRTTTLRAIAVTASAGAAATGVITIATAATGSGNLRIWIGDTVIDTAVLQGDSVTSVAASAVLNINAQTFLPVTAGAVAGVLTLTAKNAGPRGNLIRFQTAITSGIGMTATGSADAYMSGGATADSNATALGTILSTKYYRIVPAAVDSTQLLALCTQVGIQAQPVSGMVQRVIAGSVDTLANAITLATGLNNARAEISWSKFSPWTPAELAANMAAIVSLYEDVAGPNPRCNFAGFGNDATTQPFWVVPASRDTSASPTRTDVKSALNNGLSPIGVNPNRSTYLVNRITTRSLSGVVQDYRIRDSHKVTIVDFFSDDLKAKTQLQHSGKKIANDPPKGAHPPGPTVVTPTIYRGTIFGLIDQYDANDLLQDVVTIKANTIVKRGNANTTQMQARIPLDTIDCCFQFAIAVDQVG